MVKGFEHYFRDGIPTQLTVNVAALATAQLPSSVASGLVERVERRKSDVVLRCFPTPMQCCGRTHRLIEQSGTYIVSSAPRRARSAPQLGQLAV